MVFLKISATDPSSALRNAKEIVNILIEQYGSKENVPPVLILYTDREPEHCTTFLSIKTGFELAIRELQFADRIYLFADCFKHFL